MQTYSKNILRDLEYLINYKSTSKFSKLHVYLQNSASTSNKIESVGS